MRKEGNPDGEGALALQRDDTSGTRMRRVSPQDKRYVIERERMYQRRKKRAPYTQPARPKWMRLKAQSAAALCLPRRG